MSSSAQAGGSSSAAAPPSYTEAIHFAPKDRSSIPIADRQSMELAHDQTRSLPDGWIKQWDGVTGRHFYVDSKANGGEGRSTWMHPYFDEQFLKSRTPEERRKIEEENRRIASGEGGSSRQWNDLEAETTDEESEAHGGWRPSQTATGHPASASAPNISSNKPSPKGMKKLGRQMKDKMTNTTHEERARKRHDREVAEQRAYERHQQLRRAISAAAQTGQPQFWGKDKDGKDIVILPPGPQYPGAQYGYDPFGNYNPNVKYIRPADPYQSRGYGYGYGGGYGLPLAGGLMGGMLLGGMMF